MPEAFGQVDRVEAMLDRLLYPVRVRLFCRSMDSQGSETVNWAEQELILLSPDEVEQRIAEHQEACATCRGLIAPSPPAP